MREPPQTKESPPRLHIKSTRFENILTNNKMKVAIFVLASLAVVLATPVKRQAANFAYQLPDSAELIVGQLKTSFSCVGRIYGYYADQDNGCRVFHVCLPIPDDNNAIIDTAHYSFFCGNQTVFDQQNLVCTHDGDVDCGAASSLYDAVNSQFGIIPK